MGQDDPPLLAPNPAALERARRMGEAAAKAGESRESCEYVIAANRDAWARGFDAWRRTRAGA